MIFGHQISPDPRRRARHLGLVEKVRFRGKQQVGFQFSTYWDEKPANKMFAGFSAAGVLNRTNILVPDGHN
jgi:hypothetical protein